MYFPTEDNISCSTLKEIILNVLCFAEEIGFKVRHMVCDQGGPNQKAISQLNIHKDHPYIEFNNRVITFGFDSPHILKYLRNNLINHNFIMEKE